MKAEDLKSKARVGSYMDEMRDRSGRVVSDDKLVAFLYTLIRDHITPGRLEEIMLSCDYSEETLYTNGWLAEYSKDLSERLKS